MQATESIDTINSAIQILAQKAEALQRENQNKMSQLRYLLTVIPFQMYPEHSKYNQFVYIFSRESRKPHRLQAIVRGT